MHRGVSLPLVCVLSVLAGSISVLDISGVTNPTVAHASPANAGIDSTGYLYSATFADDGIQRYSLATATTETLNLDDSTCQALDRTQIFDIAVDPVDAKIYWSNSGFYFGPWGSRQARTQINEFDLKSGLCQNLVDEQYPMVWGADSYQFQGIDLDATNERLFYVDQGGASRDENLSLRYVDLDDNTDHQILLTNESPNNTVGFASDVVIEGENVYISGRQYLAPDSAGAGDSIFRVDVENAGEIVTEAVPVEILHWDPNSGSSPNVYQIDKRNSTMYFASMDFGIYKFATGDGLVTSPTQLIPPSSYPASTGSYGWTGFALGQNDEMFTIDFADGEEGWSHRAIWWASVVGSNPESPAPLAGNVGGQSYWSLPVYDSHVFPAAPKIVNATLSGSTMSVHIRRPDDFDSDGNYELVATPVGGGSPITSTCSEDGTSLCTIPGVVASQDYNLTIKHNWRTAGGETLLTSEFSPEFLFDQDLPIINEFDVFENTFNRYTYRSLHTGITAENVDEGAVPWVDVVLDQDGRDLTSATEYVTFSWFLCDEAQTQEHVSHVSFDDVATGNCEDGGYSDLYSYADQNEIGKYTTLGVRAKNSSGETFTLQSRATPNADAIIFGAEIRNSGGFIPGGSLVTYVEDVLSTTYNPAPVDSVLEKLSDFRTRTGETIVQRWYRCPSPLTVLIEIGGIQYPDTDQVPAECELLSETSDTYSIVTDDVGRYIVSALTFDDSVTQVIASQEIVAVDSPFESVSRRFSGFVTMDPDLTAKMKRAIRNWVLDHPGATSASCVGYVGNNYLGVAPKMIKDLARKRAKNSCRYARQIDPSLELGSLSVKISNSQRSSIRRVSISLD